MARYVFKMPDIGEGIVEAEIVKWHVAAGEAVREEQPLVDVMTDKATVEIAAPVSGVLLTLGGDTGSKVAVGAELVAIETGVVAPAGPAAPKPVAVVDVPVASAKTAAMAAGKALASPAVRARASSLGMALTGVPGSGPDGRIVHADLDRELQARSRSTQPKPAAMPIASGRYEEIKIVGLRRVIAERVADAARRIPHFTYVEEVDVTALEDLRATLNAGAGTGHRTVLAFIAKAVVDALRTHRNLNSHFDDAAGIVRTYEPVHLGIATQTARGLMVPVIRDAQSLDIRGLAAAIAEASEAARQGIARRQDLGGSTITITSLGALGGVMATPIINPPEVAIVGVNKIAAKPAVRGGEVTVRQLMNLSSSFDHRIIDGHDAAAFIRTVRELLEAPAGLAARADPNSDAQQS